MAKKEEKKKVSGSFFVVFFPPFFSSAAFQGEREKKKRKSTNNPSFSVIYPFLFLAETTLFSSFSFCGRCIAVLFFFFFCMFFFIYIKIFKFLRVMIRFKWKCGKKNLPRTPSESMQGRNSRCIVSLAAKRGGWGVHCCLLRVVYYP